MQNVKDILRETDKILPARRHARGRARPAGGGRASARRCSRARPRRTIYREAASVIANAETGVLTVRATSRQHEKIQEFLDQVMANAQRQVLIEATVVEVQLSNNYQRGIDWQHPRADARAGIGPELGELPSSPRTPGGLTIGSSAGSSA